MAEEQALDHLPPEFAEQWAVIAVQGPKSDEVLEAIGLPAGHEYMSFVEADFQGTGVVVCRTGYTGERGYELIASNDVAGELWDALMAAGVALQAFYPGDFGYVLHGQSPAWPADPRSRSGRQRSR